MSTADTSAAVCPQCGNVHTLYAPCSTGRLHTPDVKQQPGVKDLMELSGAWPRIGPGQRYCPTCNATGINPVATYMCCPKCNGERVVPSR